MRGSSSVPGLCCQGDLLSFAIAVLAHPQPEGHLVARAAPAQSGTALSVLPHLHLHVIHSGVVRDHKALLAETTHTNNSLVSFL